MKGFVVVVVNCYYDAGKFCDLCLTLFSSSPIHLLSTYQFVKAAKEFRTEEEKNKDTFRFKFHFCGLRFFCGVECFLNQQK